jgi:acyl carrier protein
VTDSPANSFSTRLTESDLRRPASVPGLYSSSPVFERVVRAAGDYLLAAVSTEVDARIECPPIIPFETVRAADYHASFPQLLGTVVPYLNLTDTQTDFSPNVTLSPTACHHAYPLFAAHELEAGMVVDVSNWCFRHEPSDDPFRMMSFRMREAVYVDEPARVEEWIEDAASASLTALRALGLSVELVVATDPFFGNTARLMAANQRNQGLKRELVVTVDAQRDVAVGSANYHVEHLTSAFQLDPQADGTPNHSACMAFGLERVVLALTYKYGVSIAEWPAGVLDELDLSRDDVRAAEAGGSVGVEATAEAATAPRPDEIALIRRCVLEHGRLQRPPELLNDDDELFRHGLTSLAAVSIISAIEEELRVELPDHLMSRASLESISSIHRAFATAQAGADAR